MSAVFPGEISRKWLLGKWLLANHDIITLMDEPTRGIDVGSKAEIYDLVDKLSRAGKSIIFVVLGAGRSAKSQRQDLGYVQRAKCP